jgi:hypothetical protein
MTRRFQYFAGFVWFMPAICLLSVILALDLAGWEDTPTPSPVPLSLRVAYGIVFPIHYLFDLWGGWPPPGLSDEACVILAVLVILVNGALWSFLLVFTFRLVARLARAKKGEIDDVA